MITADRIVAVYTEKLLSTGSMQEAFLKAIWVTYNEGMLEGMSITDGQKEACIAEIKKILETAYEKAKKTKEL